MKFLLQILAWVMVTMFISSCQDLETLNATFMMNHKTAIILKGAGASGIPFNIRPVPLVSRTETQFENPRSSPIQEIYVDHVKIGSKFPDSRNLSFINSLHVYIVKDGLPPQLLAFRENIADTLGNTLTLETSKINFSEYIEGENYRLQFRTVTKELITEDIELVVESRFRIVAELWK